MFWLGVDVGTGGTRALLVDEQGKARHGFTAAHDEMLMEHPLWAEQRPENWWAAAQLSIRGVLAQAGVGAAEIRGVGLSGQMHGLVLLDESSQVIRPALIWCDQRSQVQVDEINRQVGRESIVAATANPVLTGFTLPKLLWVRDNEPQNFRRAKRILLPKDYLRFQLTGEFASDVSDASGTALFDVAQRRWSERMTSALHLDPQTLPRVFESQEISGYVHQAAAEATGLLAGTPVVAGAGDQAASAIGNGIVNPGPVSCTLGTSGVVFSYLGQPNYDPAGRVHTFCHAVPEAWHVMGVTQGAGLSLQWFRTQLAPGADYDSLMREASAAPAGSQGLIWLPYLMGERTPHLDATARGGWIGLTAKHTRADLIRSLIEGVCYSQKDCLHLVETLGGKVESVRISGGGARSPFWRQTLANILGKRVVCLETQEGSAYGAALLALAGTSGVSDIRDISGRAVKEVDAVEPDRDSQAVYAQGYARYRSLYPSLRSFYASAS
jgi:xylulokinase